MALLTLLGLKDKKMVHLEVASQHHPNRFSEELNGYGAPCFHCEKIILDSQYVARTKTNGTKYYHCFCALSVNLVDNLESKNCADSIQTRQIG